MWRSKYTQYSYDDLITYQCPKISVGSANPWFVSKRGPRRDLTVRPLSFLSDVRLELKSRQLISQLSYRFAVVCSDTAVLCAQISKLLVYWTEFYWQTNFREFGFKMPLRRVCPELFWQLVYKHVSRWIGGCRDPFRSLQRHPGTNEQSCLRSLTCKFFHTCSFEM